MAAAPRAPGSPPVVFGLTFRSFFTMFFRVERGKNDTEEPPIRSPRGVSRHVSRGRIPLRIPVVVDEQSADRSSVPLDPIAVSLIVPHTGIAMLLLVVL